MRTPQTRWGAFLIHLGISAVIFLVLLYFIVFHWYPQPFFSKDGGWEGVQLITGVDLILGPTLTLIVYKLGKPRLRMDIAIIGLVQTLALVAGTWLVYGERIALVAYADGTFYSLTTEQVEHIGGPAREIALTSNLTPPLSVVRLPENRRERHFMLYQAMLQGAMPYHFSERHEAYDTKHLPQIIAAGAGPDEAVRNHPDFRTGLALFLERHGGQAGDYIYVPSVGRYGEQVIAIRKEGGELVDGIHLPSGTVARLKAADTPPGP